MLGLPEGKERSDLHIMGKLEREASPEAMMGSVYRRMSVSHRDLS